MRNALFVVAVALVTVLFIGLVVVTRSPNSTQSAALPSPTATATPSPAASTSTPVPSPTPSPSGSPYVNQTYKFSVTLPAPYRKSARLSLTNASGQNLAAAVALDAFTARTDQDEAPLAGRICDSTCAIRNYVAIVEIYTGVSQTPRQWYTSSAAGQRIDDVTVDGRTAIRVTNGAEIYLPVQLIVKDGDRIFRVGYEITPDPVPPGASRDKLEEILASFKFTP